MYVHFLQHFDFQRHEIWQQLLFCQFANLLNFSWCFSKCCLIQSCYYLDFVHLLLIKNIAINFTLEFLFVMNYKIMIYNVAYSRSRWSIWALCIFLCLECSFNSCIIILIQLPIRPYFRSCFTIETNKTPMTIFNKKEMLKET